MNQATEKGNGIDLRPEWGIFIPSVLVIILISIPAVLYPKAAEEVVSAIYQPFAANFGTLYLWITVGLIILCRSRIPASRSGTRTRSRNSPCLHG